MPRPPAPPAAGTPLLASAARIPNCILPTAPERRALQEDWPETGSSGEEERGTLLSPEHIDHEGALKGKGDVPYAGKSICSQKISAGCLKMNILHVKVSFERA